MTRALSLRQGEAPQTEIAISTDKRALMISRLMDPRSDLSSRLLMRIYGTWILQPVSISRPLLSLEAEML